VRIGFPFNRRLALAGGGLALLGLGGAAFFLSGKRTVACPNEVRLPPKAEYALSLRGLQEQMARCPSAVSCPDEARRLYGLTAIGGYVIDKKNRDIVLFGNKNTQDAALDVDDFVVALRNLNHRYLIDKNGQQYFSYPTVSIDPTSDTLRQWYQLARDFNAAASVDDFDPIIRRWEAVCAAPQNVRLIGVPSNTRFARVMLAADYKLKDASNGTIELPGVTNMMQAALDSMTAAAGNNQRAEMDVTSRFWFSAGESSYSAGQTTALLTRVDVELLTEVEFATESGQLKGTGKTNKLSEQFACEVSTHFPSIADRDPTYQDLWNLFRWMALVRIMIDEQAIEKSGVDFAVLLDRFAPAELSVPTTVPGRSAVGRRDGAGYVFRVPSCGGVEIKFEKDGLARDNSYTEMREQIGDRVLAARPSDMASAVWRIS
jgi:hypothetical protein